MKMITIDWYSKTYGDYFDAIQSSKAIQLLQDAGIWADNVKIREEQEAIKYEDDDEMGIKYTRVVDIFFTSDQDALQFKLMFGNGKDFTDAVDNIKETK